MPNEIKPPSPDRLDNVCLTPTQSPVQSLYTSEYIKAMAKIEERKMEKSRDFSNYIQKLERSSTKAIHLKTLLKFQRENAPNKTMRECNTIPIACIRKDQSPKENPITLKVNEYAYSMSGLNRCKNPFCVMCSKSRAGERANRIKQGIQGAFNAGLGVYFVTFTIPRQKSITTARKEVTERWKNMTKLFTRWKRKIGIRTHYARALDVTFKKYKYHQRYHLHIHAVIVLDDVAILNHCNTDSNPKEHTIKSLLINQWMGLNRVGMNCKEVSQDVQKVTNSIKDTAKVSKYCGKMAGLALEISNGTMKKSGSSSSLSDLMLDNTPKTIEIYQEYLRGMKKARTLQFSRYWDELIDDEEGEDLETFEIDIPLDKWKIVEPIWLDLADKLQFELFKMSKNASGETDVYRQYQIIKEIRWFLDNADTTEFLELFLTTSFDRMEL
jgi:aromatic ring-cleaving dioxygenase